ncbi:MAG: response regulator transcription factor [Sandaracinaceae bacterium]|nr:MAG: response regulator transcription factor [Sandaracinaceae bacterium]HBQ09689.1 DNA-binding response regulator [Myxococcales bacterium]
MWILVVGSPHVVEREQGGAQVLGELGCRVRKADLWDRLDAPEIVEDPPTAVLVEAIDEVDAGRAALMRLRGISALVDVPVLLAVTVNAIQSIKPSDAFDDVVLVPYVPVELYVRIRRAEWGRSEFESQERIKVGRVLLDVAAHEVEVDGRPVQLTQQEFALLRFLASNRGRVFSRQQLLERVWGVSYYGGSRTVDIHVRRLRMKLGKDALPIETVRGVGYKMKAP